MLIEFLFAIVYLLFILVFWLYINQLRLKWRLTRIQIRAGENNTDATAQPSDCFDGPPPTRMPAAEGVDSDVLDKSEFAPSQGEDIEREDAVISSLKAKLNVRISMETGLYADMNEIIKYSNLNLKYSKLDEYIHNLNQPPPRHVDEKWFEIRKKEEFDWQEFFLDFHDAFDEKHFDDIICSNKLEAMASKLKLCLYSPKRGERYNFNIHSPYGERKEPGFERGLVLKTVLPGIKKKGDLLKKPKVLISK